MDNSFRFWNKLWDKYDSLSEYLKLSIIKEENSLTWNLIETTITKYFGSFQDLKIIEIGAGIGTYAILFAKKGANVSVMDFSENALLLSKNIFEHWGVEGNFIHMDALKLSSELLEKYDVSMSFGLAEHFKNNERIQIILNHFRLLKVGGVSIISVPNKYNFPYRIWLFLSKIRRSWTIYESSFSKKEIKNICKKIGISKFHIFCNSFWESFSFINPFTWQKKIIKKGACTTPKIKREKKSFLDKFWGYRLILVGQK